MVVTWATQCPWRQISLPLLSARRNFSLPHSNHPCYLHFPRSLITLLSSFCSTVLSAPLLVSFTIYSVVLCLHFSHPTLAYFVYFFPPMGNATEILFYPNLVVPGWGKSIWADVPRLRGFWLRTKRLRWFSVAACTGLTCQNTLKSKRNRRQIWDWTHKEAATWKK